MPTNKVMLGAAIGALTTIIVWCIQQFGHIQIPVEISGALQTVLVFVGQYLIPNSQAQVTAAQQYLNAANAPKP